MGFNLNSMIMKKILLAVFVVSLAFVSCTDNTEEHEELLNSIQSIDKEDTTTSDSDGENDGDNGI
ncbi:hypothetical protein [Tenacibaculum sp. nBUS_03]|uniref:hypothetical protein n=1 Tax=Tenacibaculum sp. nBUS_03 TaxID=3395320 RepID=UPI003EC15624